MIHRLVAFLISLTLLVPVVTVPKASALTVTSSISQYMNGWQNNDNALTANHPITNRSSAGFWTYDQGWRIYNNSVNDDNTNDIEFTLQKDFSLISTQKRYCITARDVMPYGVRAKIQIWTGEYIIVPGYPYGLETDPHDFIPTTQPTKEYAKFCSSWTKIITPTNGTPQPYQRLSIVGAVVITQGAMQIKSVSIESI